MFSMTFRSCYVECPADAVLLHVVSLELKLRGWWFFRLFTQLLISNIRSGHIWTSPRLVYEPNEGDLDCWNIIINNFTVFKLSQFIPLLKIFHCFTLEFLFSKRKPIKKNRNHFPVQDVIVVNLTSSCTIVILLKQGFL